MAESKGWEKALRRVMWGGAVSTESEAGTPSNMGDCVATLRIDFTRCEYVELEKNGQGDLLAMGKEETDRQMTGPREAKRLKPVPAAFWRRRWPQRRRTFSGSARRGLQCLQVSACR